MPETDLPITGESAVVTASGSGIGLQVAEALAESGVDVVINDIDESVLEDALSTFDDTPGSVLSVVGDARRPGEIEHLIETAVDEYGGLDILVNNVGIAGPTKPAEDTSPDEFMRTMETNVGGHFNAVHAAIPYLRESEAGRIVNLSSISGKRPLENRVPYATAKMGVIGLTRTLAVELAPDGVTVNAICPGPVEGPRIEQVIEGQARSRGKSYEEIERELREASPMDEFVQGSDIADLVLYLCSERATHITGQDLNVSAGICMY